MVVIKVSAKLAGTKQPVIAAASYPLGWVPVIRLDPALSRHEADLLLECLKMGNCGRLIDFALSLTSAEIVQDYEWGEACWDCVCALCGAVWGSTGLNEAVCEGCQPPTDNRGLSPDERR